MVLALLGGIAAGLSQGLAACVRLDRDDQPRPLSTAEAQRLAAMRQQNYRDARTGLRATIGTPGKGIHLSGWVDWTRPLAYLAVAGTQPAGAVATSSAEAGRSTAPSPVGSPGDGGSLPAPATRLDGLIQAIPGLIASRPDAPAAQPASNATAEAPAALNSPGPSRTGSPSGAGGSRSRTAATATPGSSASAGTGPPATGSTPPTTSATPRGAGAKRRGAVTTPPPPPAVPPKDGWRVRPLSAAGGVKAPLDTFVALLFVLAADHPDAADLLAHSDARWLARQRADGVPVDVLLGPAVPPTPKPPTSRPFGPVVPKARPTAATNAPTGPPTANPPTAGGPATGRPTAAPPTAGGPATGQPTAKGARPAAGASWLVSPSTSGPPSNSLAAMGGAVRYWLDDGSRVHRLEALLGNDLPVRIDFLRDQRPQLTGIGPLGGAAVAPRTVTAAEARALAQLRRRDRATGGGRITVTLPAGTAGLVRGTGWLDWRSLVAYLSVEDADRPADGLLLLADRAGLASRTLPDPARGRANGDKTAQSGASGPPPPPLPLPRERNWDFQPWSQRGDKWGAYDLDLLLSEALSLGMSSSPPTTASGGRQDSAEQLRKTAAWLRTDVVGRVPVTVYEMPRPAEYAMPKGAARLRYWVDRAGALRRLEIRTRTGGIGQLDLDPGALPRITGRR